MGNDTSPGGDASPPRRDAEATSQRLLKAARRRFARDGYALTTTRSIARDAGVNVALISRYFGSKRGLFEACLRPALDGFRASTATLSSPSDVADVLLESLASSDPEAGIGAMFLARSSGDEATDALRLEILQQFSERLAGLVSPELPEEERALRAQLALCVGFGIATMRTSIALAPLAEASPDELIGPIRELAAALLARDLP